MEVLSVTDHDTPSMQAQPPDLYTRTKPKKGKPLPMGHLVRFLKEHEGRRIVLTGPDFVGCTTLMRLLERHEFTTLQLAPKPPPDTRHTFVSDYFSQLVAAWTQIPAQPQSYVIEDSPWAYLTRHLSHIPPQDHASYRAQLTHLDPPTFTIILHTSGVAIGRRHPLHRTTPELYAPTAIA